MVKQEVNAYEEARRLRVQENLKLLQGLGISKLAKSLKEVPKHEKKLPKCPTSPKPKEKLGMEYLRRSSRTRTMVSSYRDEIYYDEDRVSRSHCRRSRSGSDYRGYHGRIASYEQQVRAVKKAEELRNNLKSGHPSFVKSMVRSHVSSCFWLGLPTKFCKEHLPPNELKMVLEDEKGLECDSVYIGNRTGLSGGWRGFALDHDLEDGDALIFELSESNRFKIYIIKAMEDQDSESSATNPDVEGIAEPVKEMEAVEEDMPIPEKKPPTRTGSSRRSKRVAERSPLS